MIDWDNDWKFKQPKLNRKERRKLSKKNSIKKNPIRLIEKVLFLSDLQINFTYLLWNSLILL